MALKPGQKFQGFNAAETGTKKKLTKYVSTFFFQNAPRTSRFMIDIVYRASLEERLQVEEDVEKVKLAPSAGAREMTFTLQQVIKIRLAGLCSINLPTCFQI